MRAQALVLVLAALAVGCSQNAAPESSGFAVELSPKSLSLPRSSQASATLTVYPSGGFSGAVSLAYEGLPSGVTASPGEAAVEGRTEVPLTFAASDAAPVGTHLVKVRVEGGGVVRTVRLSLTVASEGWSGGGGQAVTVRVDAPQGDPVLVYYSTDGANFRALELSGEGEGVFQTPGEYVLAARCLAPRGGALILRAHPSEVNLVPLRCGESGTGGGAAVTASASVSAPDSLGGRPVADSDLVYLGEASAPLARGSAQVYSAVPREATRLVLALLRPIEGSPGPFLDPLGFAVHDRASPDEDAFSVSAEDWRPFAAQAGVVVPTQAGETWGASVRFYPEGGAGHGTLVGYGDRYGVTGEPGTYVGEAWRRADLEGGATAFAFERRRLSGEDWLADFLPVPQADYSPQSGRLSFEEAQGAEVYFLQGDVLTDTETGEPVHALVVLTRPRSGWPLPVVPELKYGIRPNPSSYALGVAAGGGTSSLAEALAGGASAGEIRVTALSKNAH